MGKRINRNAHPYRRRTWNIIDEDTPVMTSELDPRRGIVIVRDHGVGLTRSITNDAERVIRKLDAYYDLSDKLVIYEDGYGEWGALFVRDGEFAGFHLLFERSVERAIRKLRCEVKAGTGRVTPP